MVPTKLILIVAVEAVVMQPTNSYIHDLSRYCVCPRHYDRVCGSNGITYSNPCLLTCVKPIINDLTILFGGPCTEVHLSQDETQQEPIDVHILAEELMKHCACDMIHSPVCGNDGYTYANACVVECIKKEKGDLKIIWDGECMLDNIRWKKVFEFVVSLANN